ncbi:MAG: hypothetical protein KC912_25640 [Proteobacteria bacterium]|nr:hypothetical protein [Pseudomonadota bacterium]
MRIASVLGSALALVALNACGGETCGDGTSPVDGECPCATDGLYPSDHDDGQCPPECAVGYTSIAGECRWECDDASVVASPDDCPLPLLDPVAVGFEYEGGFVDGEWSEWSADDGSGNLVTVPPAIYVTFTNAAYFEATTAEAQQYHHCIVYALVDGETAIGTSIPTNGGAVLNSWDIALAIDPASWTTDSDESCGVLLDPEVWGTNGVDLQNAFTGMHLGIGFGPMTTYLEDAWDETTLLDYGDAMFAEYIAMNDKNGAFVGEDWTTGLHWQWDDTTKEPLAVDGNYVPSDISTASSYPNGFLRGSPFWYQDFPLLDLSNLKDGAPTATR